MVVEVGQTFDAYVRGKGDGLIRLAWLVTRNWDDARDCVQDAFVGVYPRWSDLARSDRLDAYVNRSVVNAAITCARRRRRATPVAEPQLLLRAPVGGDPAAEVVGADAAWRLCADLPPKQRAAVVLRFYRDLDFAEIGEILGCPEATARSHVHRALAALRAQLGERGSDE
jgi:RNA polymerase sigma-70 factor (sigma-E family)